MTTPQAIGVVAGVVLFVIGFALLAVARRPESGPRWWLLVGPVSKATETAAGLGLVFAGYHLVAYLGPPGWVTFRVPTDLAWLVFVVAGAAVVGGVVGDRVLGHGDGDEAPGDEAAPEPVATEDDRVP